MGVIRPKWPAIRWAAASGPTSVLSSRRYASNGKSRHARIVFGAAWLGVIVAAAVGNYPTPLVGYGGSAVIGYVLSAFALPPAAAHAVSEGKDLRAGSAQEGRNDVGDARLRGVNFVAFGRPNTTWARRSPRARFR